MKAPKICKKTEESKLPVTLLQLIKFCLVGASNTLITAGVIFLMLRLLKCSDLISNIVGYIAGLLNSFVWNRWWTFSSKLPVRKTVLKFILTFAVSYALQLIALTLLLKHTGIDSYYCQLLAMLVYTAVNFGLNKFYTFKEASE